LPTNLQNFTQKDLFNQSKNIPISFTGGYFFLKHPVYTVHVWQIILRCHEFVFLITVVAVVAVNMRIKMDFLICNERDICAVLGLYSMSKPVVN